MNECVQRGKKKRNRKGGTDKCLSSFNEWFPIQMSKNMSGDGDEHCHTYNLRHKCCGVSIKDDINHWMQTYALQHELLIKYDEESGRKE